MTSTLRKLARAFALALTLAGPVLAQTAPTPTSALPAASSAATGDLLPVSKTCSTSTTGYCSYKVSLQQIGQLIGSAAPAVASPSFTGAAKFNSGVDDTSTKDVTSAATSIIASPGNGVIFCPQLSCRPRGFTGHQRASVLISSPTLYDGEFEEQTLAVVTDIGTGYSQNWAAGHAYSIGDNVISDNQVWRATTAGTTGTSQPLKTAAPGTVVDGGVTWQWISGAPIDSKVGIYNETRVMPGAGQGWALANNIAFLAGWNGSFGAGVENDVGNSSGDATVGGPKFIVNTWVNTNTVDPITIGLEVSGKAHWGIWEQGALDIGLNLTDSATVGLNLQGTHSSIAMAMTDVSPEAINFHGTHSLAILDSTNDIAGTFAVLKDGQVVCFAGQAWCVKHDTNTNKFTFTGSNNAVLATLDNAGNWRTAGSQTPNVTP